MRDRRIEMSIKQQFITCALAAIVRRYQMESLHKEEEEEKLFEIWQMLIFQFEF